MFGIGREVGWPAFEAASQVLDEINRLDRTVAAPAREPFFERLPQQGGFRPALFTRQGIQARGQFIGNLARNRRHRTRVLPDVKNGNTGGSKYPSQKAGFVFLDEGIAQRRGDAEFSRRVCGYRSWLFATRLGGSLRAARTSKAMTANAWNWRNTADAGVGRMAWNKGHHPSVTPPVCRFYPAID